MNIAKLYPKSKQAFCLVNNDLDILLQDADRLTGLECLHLISKMSNNLPVANKIQDVAPSSSVIHTSELSMFDRVGRPKVTSVPVGPICIIGESDEELQDVGKKLRSYFEQNSQIVEQVDINRLSSQKVKRLGSDKLIIVLCNIVKTKLELLLSVVLQCPSQIFLPISTHTIHCSLNAASINNRYIERILQSMEHNQQVRKYLLASLSLRECLICSGDKEHIRVF